MKDIGIIGSADGPTSIYVSSSSEDFWQSGGIVPEDNDTEINIDKMVSENGLDNTTEEVVDISLDDKLNSKTLSENLDDGFKIMGIGMAAVFGVLTILYIIVKIMGKFAKGNKDKENSNEKN